MSLSLFNTEEYTSCGLSASVEDQWRGVYHFILAKIGILISKVSYEISSTQDGYNMTVIWYYRNFAMWRCFRLECGWAGQVS